MDTDHRSAELLHVASSIVRSGYAVVAATAECTVVGCDCGVRGTSWVYTVGLVESGLPELVVVGLAPRFARQLIAPLADSWRASGVTSGGRRVLDLHGVPARLAPVPHAWLAHDPSRMDVWVRHYGPGRQELAAPRLVQVLWGDAAGRFPGDPGCDPFVAQDQPVLAADPVAFPPPGAPLRADRRGTRVA